MIRPSIPRHSNVKCSRNLFPLFDNTVQSFRQVENFCILYLAIILLVSNLIEYFKPRIKHILCMASTRVLILGHSFIHRLFSFLVAHFGRDMFNNKANTLSKYLRVVLESIPYACYWKHRGFWNSKSRFLHCDGVHLNNLGHFKLYRSLRGAILGCWRALSEAS